MYHFGVILAVFVLCESSVVGGLLQLQRQIKYGCNFSLVLILSNVPVYIGPYRVAYVVCIYACLRILHQFNVLLEISVALVPCILAVMPSNIL